MENYFLRKLFFKNYYYTTKISPAKLLNYSIRVIYIYRIHRSLHSQYLNKRVRHKIYRFETFYHFNPLSTRFDINLENCYSTDEIKLETISYLSLVIN